ncbi:Protein of unknown function [Gryllus bimaculatus]|nr:Protein of unknown function [Gryllus bimaculatus]
MTVEKRPAFKLVNLLLTSDRCCLSTHWRNNTISIADFCTGITNKMRLHHSYPSLVLDAGNSNSTVLLGVGYALLVLPCRRHAKGLLGPGAALGGRQGAGNNDYIGAHSRAGRVEPWGGRHNCKSIGACGISKLKGAGDARPPVRACSGVVFEVDAKPTRSPPVVMLPLCRIKEPCCESYFGSPVRPTVAEFPEIAGLYRQHIHIKQGAGEVCNITVVEHGSVEGGVGYWPPRGGHGTPPASPPPARPSPTARSPAARPPPPARPSTPRPPARPPPATVRGSLVTLDRLHHVRRSWSTRRRRRRLAPPRAASRLTARFVPAPPPQLRRRPTTAASAPSLRFCASSTAVCAAWPVSGDLTLVSACVDCTSASFAFAFAFFSAFAYSSTTDSVSALASTYALTLLHLSYRLSLYLCSAFAASLPSPLPPPLPPAFPPYSPPPQPPPPQCRLPAATFIRTSTGFIFDFLCRLLKATLEV